PNRGRAAAARPAPGAVRVHGPPRPGRAPRLPRLHGRRAVDADEPADGPRRRPASRTDCEARPDRDRPPDVEREALPGQAGRPGAHPQRVAESATTRRTHPMTARLARHLSAAAVVAGAVL